MSGPWNPRRPRSPAAARAGHPRSSGASLRRPGVGLPVEEVVRVVAQKLGVCPLRAVRSCPPHAVGDDPAHVLVMVGRVVLVPRTEVEDLAVTSAERASAAEHLAAAEGAEEDQLVGDRNVEELAVHLVFVDHQRMRHSFGDRVRGVDRPHQLAVVLTTPAQRAGCPHQLDEDPRPVPGVQYDQAHAGQDVAVYPLDHVVADLGVRGVPPPGEHVGPGEHLLGEGVLRFVEGGRANYAALAEILGDALGDRRVHALWIDLRHVLLELFVAVLAPYGHAEGSGGFLDHVWCCLSSGHLTADLTAPPVTPAVTYRWATSSSATAGMEASTAVAITELQSFTYVPMYWKSPSVTGRTSSVVVSVSANRKSLQVNRNVNRAAVMSALRLIGNTMDTKALIWPAPSTLAASTTSVGMAPRNARRMRIANGIPAVESARIRPGIEFSRPRLL